MNIRLAVAAIFGFVAFAAAPAQADVHSTTIIHHRTVVHRAPVKHPVIVRHIVVHKTVTHTVHH